MTIADKIDQKFLDKVRFYRYFMLKRLAIGEGVIKVDNPVSYLDLLIEESIEFLKD